MEVPLHGRGIGGWRFCAGLPGMYCADRLAHHAGRNRVGLLTADPVRLLFWHTLFMLVTAFIIARGVVAGLERSLRIMMPLLFLLLLILLGYSLTTGHFMSGVKFLFHFDLQSVPEGILATMGHAFFTLSVGVGSIMVFGAYMPKKSSIGGTIITVALLDTAVALIAGLALFPIVFTAGLESSAGPGLMFVTLPIAFGNIVLGHVFGVLFLCACRSGGMEFCNIHVGAGGCLLGRAERLDPHADYLPGRLYLLAGVAGHRVVVQFALRSSTLCNRRQWVALL
jgi:SNF family Na+-dependent transporter